jgi:hypothetical protein
MKLSRLDDVTKTLASIVELGRRGDVMTPADA